MKNKSIKHFIVLLCCCGIAASSIGSVINTVGVFLTPVASSLGVLRGTFALHSTIITIAIAIVSLFAPKLMEKFNFKLLILAGAILAGGSTVAMAFVTSMPAFYTLAAIKGIGSAIYNSLLITTIINNWFVKKNGLATSLTLSFSGVAGAVLSPILTNIITSSTWNNAYIALGIITFVLNVPAIIYPFHIDPRDDGLLPYGYEEGTTTKKQTVTSNSHFNALTVPFMIYLVTAVLYCAITSVTSHLPGYAESIGVSASIGALMISGAMIGNIASKLIIGVLADILGSVKAVLVMSIMTIIALTSILLFHTDMMLMISSVLLGSIYGIGAVGISLLTKEFFGAMHYTQAYSKVCFATNFGAAFAASAIGYMYDFFESYHLAFLFLIGFLVFNMVMITLLNKMTVK